MFIARGAQLRQLFDPLSHRLRTPILFRAEVRDFFIESFGEPFNSGTKTGQCDIFNNVGAAANFGL